MAALDELDHVLEADIESDRVVGAGELIERPLEIVLVGVQLHEDLLDPAAFLEHGPEPILQHPLLGADVVDAGLKIDGLVAGALDLRKALGLGQPRLDRGHSVFGVGAGELVDARLGVDLGLDQAPHAVAYAKKPGGQRLRRPPLKHQLIREPDGGKDQRQRYERDHFPCHLEH